jgi:hypothetical protein
MFGTAGMATLAEPIGKIKRIIAAAGEQSQADQAKPENTATETMIINIRDVLDVFAAFRDDRIIDDKIALLTGVFINTGLMADF